MDRREPLAVKICCRWLPTKSPVIASCVADGCFTVSAYSDMVEKLVMAAEVSAGPGDATACRAQASNWVCGQHPKADEWRGRRWQRAARAIRAQAEEWRGAARRLGEALQRAAAHADILAQRQEQRLFLPPRQPIDAQGPAKK